MSESMTRNERLNLFYCIVVSLCWIHKRPVTLLDLFELLKLTQKQIRKELTGLEEQRRISKVPYRKDSNGRICAAWVISDNKKLPPEIRDMCQACGIRKAIESEGNKRFCKECFLGIDDQGRRITLTEAQEFELSLGYAIIRDEPPEYIIE